MTILNTIKSCTYPLFLLSTFSFISLVAANDYTKELMEIIDKKDSIINKVKSIKELAKKNPRFNVNRKYRNISPINKIITSSNKINSIRDKVQLIIALFEVSIQPGNIKLDVNRRGATASPLVEIIRTNEISAIADKSNLITILAIIGGKLGYTGLDFNQKYQDMHPVILILNNKNIQGNKQLELIEKVYTIANEYNQTICFDKTTKEKLIKVVNTPISPSYTRRKELIEIIEKQEMLRLKEYTIQGIYVVLFIIGASFAFFLNHPNILQKKSKA